MTIELQININLSGEFYKSKSMNSEFRKDPVSRDWVIISPNRSKRPFQFKENVGTKIVPQKGCPFENPQKSGNGQPVLIYPDKKNWQLQIIPNKFPALTHSNKICSIPKQKGPYEIMAGNGFDELLITRNHFKNFAHLSKKAAQDVFKNLKKRYLILSKHDCLKYIFIFHNWGLKAGASIFHPHYRISALPIIPPDVSRSLYGSLRYHQDHNRCVHCDMIDFERKEKKRIIFENTKVIAFTPFVSREPFEIKIFPKNHISYFEESDDALINSIVDGLQNSLLMLEKHLNDPNYNFFIHTAPLIDKNKYFHYHWHIEIVPKFSVSAGVEVGTGIEITVVDPDKAASILRRK
ncbi:hypothetical protein COV23_02450 [Candidatus Wolfebacteria bacterium CG10_big_fil_rev_8_21_14_0_10_31_9]|uniref:Galactose-1-phosphate uridyl transferase N-terminal domain-containing protein n=1 Tax=Candidatus Wolfebacteria bacterium CG10_big_fil_rev_8_21_14_0_10_31_9 TaxID=1975070 RepID=A0A2H0RBW4_9BACT|nr:MAG: hypothetical protein COV23_02450 [Candidatus Wolfebacteria bacterium CG10_big_fil_rev_8_21_14_0_10_31_9]